MGFGTVTALNKNLEIIQLEKIPQNGRKCNVAEIWEDVKARILLKHLILYHIGIYIEKKLYVYRKVVT